LTLLVTIGPHRKYGRTRNTFSTHPAACLPSGQKKLKNGEHGHTGTNMTPVAPCRWRCHTARQTMAGGGNSQCRSSGRNSCRKKSTPLLPTTSKREKYFSAFSLWEAAKQLMSKEPNCSTMEEKVSK
jgi:hypothetical protein